MTSNSHALVVEVAIDIAIDIAINAGALRRHECSMRLTELTNELSKQTGDEGDRSN